MSKPCYQPLFTVELDAHTDTHDLREAMRTAREMARDLGREVDVHIDYIDPILGMRLVAVVHPPKAKTCSAALAFEDN